MGRKYSSFQYYKRSSNSSDPTMFVVLIAVGLVVLLPIQYFGWQMEQALVVLAGTLVVILAVIGVVAAWIWRRKQLAERAWSFSKVDHLRGIDFEHYLRGLLSSRGFRNVVVTQAAGDFGADLVGEFKGERYVVQAKQYNLWKPVGISAVQQVVGALPRYSATRSMVITTGYFTHQAKSLAENHHTVMIDRDELKQWISEYQGKRYVW